MIEGWWDMLQRHHARRKESTWPYDVILFSTLAGATRAPIVLCDELTMLTAWLMLVVSLWETLSGKMHIYASLGEVTVGVHGAIILIKWWNYPKSDQGAETIILEGQLVNWYHNIVVLSSLIFAVSVSDLSTMMRCQDYY